MSKMSERIFIGNDEDSNIKLKIEDESEPRSAKELKEIPPTFDSNKDLLPQRLAIPTKSTIKSSEIGEHSSSSQNATIELLSHNATNEPLPKNVTNEPLLEKEVRKFICQYCDKKFSSYQSLGGHQTVHRHQHALKKEEGKRRMMEEMNSTLRFTLQKR
ncbi:zinc finger protein [Trifolium repens]|jgi:aspartate carbamoyltransferase regulatory subunit|nr:zinc finger protein [Trifolium repens]